MRTHHKQIPDTFLRELWTGFSVFQVENFLMTYDPHAVLVIYSVIDESSFAAAKEIMLYLEAEYILHEKTTILVGNKTDIVRRRRVSHEGSYDTPTAKNVHSFTYDFSY